MVFKIPLVNYYKVSHSYVWTGSDLFIGYMSICTYIKFLKIIYQAKTTTKVSVYVNYREGPLNW